MANFYAIATLKGQSAIAAAVAGTAPLTLSTMVVGDGGGSPVQPIETQVRLVNQRAAVAVQTIVRDVSTPTQVTVDALLDENTGGFTIREIGILDPNGVLLFVASVPDTDKETLSQGVYDQLTLGMIIVVSTAAQITLQITDTTFVTQDSLDQQLDAWRTNISTPLRPYWITVESATLASPPNNPTDGLTYLVPDSPSGAWLNLTNKVVQYVVRKLAWVAVDYPQGSFISVKDTGRTLKRTASGWRDGWADGNGVNGFTEHKAGTATDLFANPAGVAAMIGDRVGADLLLFLGCM